MDGNEANAGLAQPSGQEQALAQSRSVAIAKPRIFLRDVESVACLANDEIDGLGVESVHPGHQARTIGVAAGGIEGVEQGSAVIQFVERATKGHVVACFSRQRKWRILLAQPRGTVGENLAKACISRQAVVAGGAAKSRQHRAKPRLDRRRPVVRSGIVVAGHHPMRAAAVAGVAVRERTNERKFVRTRGHALERSADLHARQARAHCAGNGADFGGSARLRIEGLDLRWTAGQPEPNDRGLLGNRSRMHLPFTGPKEARKGKGAETQCADAEKIATRSVRAAHPVLGREHGKHGQRPSQG